MEATVEFKKGSLSYWFYKTGFEYVSHAEDETDICSYRARVMFGAFKVLLVTAVVSVMVGFIGWMLYAHFFLSSSAIVAIALACNYDNIVLWFRNRHSDEVDVTGQVVPRQRGFIRAAYRSYKDKVCYKVRIVE